MTKITKVSLYILTEDIIESRINPNAYAHIDTKMHGRVLRVGVVIDVLDALRGLDQP